MKYGVIHRPLLLASLASLALSLNIAGASAAPDTQAQNFDASMGTPRVVDKRLVYMTPEWRDAFGYTTHLSDTLSLEMAIAGSPLLPSGLMDPVQLISQAR